MLAELYVSQGKLDQARQEMEALAVRQPKPVAAHTMIGILLQAEGRIADARQRYEKVLQIDRRAPVAANNLAWIYAESGQNLGVALELAQTAKAAMPRVAAVNDTLGYVYLKRDVPTLAVPPLREAVDGRTGQRHLPLPSRSGPGPERADRRRQTGARNRPAPQGGLPRRRGSAPPPEDPRLTPGARRSGGLKSSVELT